MKSIVHEDMTVLEVGSGGSTIWFAERCNTVISYENDKEWYMKVADEIESRGLPAEVIFYESYLPDYERYEYDLVFIDGPTDTRSMCLLGATPYVKAGGWLILDNATPVLYRGVMARMDMREWLVNVRIGYKWFDENSDPKHYFTQFWRQEHAGEGNDPAIVGDYRISK